LNPARTDGKQPGPRNPQKIRESDIAGKKLIHPREAKGRASSRQIILNSAATKKRFKPPRSASKLQIASIDLRIAYGI
jgi:hypothetical protein